MGSIFKVPAMIIYFAGGLWGLVICLGIVTSKFGTFAAVVGFFILPITVYLAPWYAGFADGNWMPVAVVGTFATFGDRPQLLTLDVL